MADVEVLLVVAMRVAMITMTVARITIAMRRSSRRRRMMIEVEVEARGLDAVVVWRLP